MRPNPQETADLVTSTKKSLMENFIFYAVFIKKRLQHRSFLLFSEGIKWEHWPEMGLDILDILGLTKCLYITIWHDIRIERQSNSLQIYLCYSFARIFISRRERFYIPK